MNHEPKPAGGTQPSCDAQGSEVKVHIGTLSRAKPSMGQLLETGRCLTDHTVYIGVERMLMGAQMIGVATKVLQELVPQQPAAAAHHQDTLGPRRQHLRRQVRPSHAIVAFLAHHTPVIQAAASKSIDEFT